MLDYVEIRKAAREAFEAAKSHGLDHQEAEDAAVTVVASVTTDDDALVIMVAEIARAELMRMPTWVAPCPFCGSKVDDLDPDFVYPATRDRTVWAAHCTAGGTGCGASMSGWSAADAVTNWNKRP